MLAISASSMNQESGYIKLNGIRFAVFAPELEEFFLNKDTSFESKILTQSEWPLCALQVPNTFTDHRFTEAIAFVVTNQNTTAIHPATA